MTCNYQQQISPSYGRIQEELEVGGDAEAALRTANIGTTAPIPSKEQVASKSGKECPQEGRSGEGGTGETTWKAVGGGEEDG